MAESGKVTQLNSTGNKKLDRALYTMANEIISRSFLADRLGKSYYSTSGSGAKRDLYKALGYILNPTFNDYYAKYKRGDIAKRIVDALPVATWRKKPFVNEPGSPGINNTPFEKAWNDLVKRRNVWHYLSRIDKISGIGQFGVLFLGIGDGLLPEQPARKAKELLYLRPYTQGAVTIEEWEENPKDPRFGQPKIYTIDIDSRIGSTSRNVVRVHHSRIIHVADGLIDNDIYGSPRLEIVLNRLQDLDLLTGGSAEMFWRGAQPGYVFSAEPDAQFGSQSLADLEDEIQDYLHDLRRYMRLQGIKVDALEQQVASPKDHVDVLLTVIAAAINIPKRILLGSERGELASSQDERAWLERIDERRVDQAEPMILRPFIDRMIEFGILPQPVEPYEVEWPPLVAMGQKEEVDIARVASEAIAKYAGTPGADMIVPVKVFLKKFLKFNQVELEEVESEFGGMLEGGFGGDENLDDEGNPIDQDFFEE